MKMQVERLFRIIYILLHREKILAKDLAEELGVSRRTICRDVDTLSLAGIPIYTERGKKGGISLMSDFVLNKSILSEQEQNEILSALQGLSNIKTDDTNEILTKLSSVFNRHATNWLEVDFSGWAHEFDFFNDFKTAITQRRIAEFDYYNSYGNKTHRRVEPIQLWFKSNAWYLKGFCLAKQDLRLYKLSRMKQLLVTDEHFSERASLIVSGNPMDNNYKEEKNITLKMRIEPEMAYRIFDVFHESFVEKQPDGSFLITVKWAEDQWLYGFILSFGQYIEVLESAHIRSIIQEEAEKISKKHQ